MNVILVLFNLTLTKSILKLLQLLNIISKYEQTVTLYILLLSITVYHKSNNMTFGSGELRMLNISQKLQAITSFNKMSFCSKMYI